jgi:hypothetical protein
MSEFPRDDPRPGWLVEWQAEGTDLSQVEVDKIPYDYTIVRAGIPHELPFAVGYPEKTALFISENVPEAHIPFLLTHEVREKEKYGQLPEEDRCPAALRDEISDILKHTPDLYKEYMQQREAFFEALVRYYNSPEHEREATSAFKFGIAGSLDILKAHTQSFSTLAPPVQPQL